jgi:hypothetical protein
MSYVDKGVAKEVNGAAYRISATRNKPQRGLDTDAEAEARRQLQPGETANTHFATVGERGIIDEIRNASATDIRGDMEVTKYTPSVECIECGAPDSWHDRIRPAHAPVYRVPGVSDGVERLNENDPNSPNHLARRPETGEFLFALDEADPAYQAAQDRFDRRHARFRPDPNDPNWRS